MSTMPRTISALTAFSFFLFSCGGGAPVELSLNLKKGDVFETQTTIRQEVTTSTLGMNINVDQTMEVYQKLTVKDAANGENTIESKTTRFVMKQNMPMMGMPINMEYDTDNPEKGGALGESMEPYFSLMKDLTYTIVLDNKGKMLRSDMEQVYKNLGLDSLSKQGGKNKNEGNAEQYLNQLPDKPIKKGDTYQTEQKNTGAGFGLKNTYTVKEIKADKVILDIKSEFLPADSDNPLMQVEIKGEQTGTAEIDRKTGMTLKSEISQNLDMVITSMGMKMPTKTKGTITFVCTPR